MIIPHEYKKRAFCEEITQVMLGKLIHTGSTRVVYQLLNLPYVVKVEDDVSSQNMREWMTWNDAKGTPLEKWLAPVICLSKNGRMLVQAMTTPIQGMLLPDLLPVALEDLKVQNFGVFEDRIVCHDYGHNKVMEIGAKSTKMKPAKWWDEQTKKYLATKDDVTF